jgi:hypothetical protein
MVSGLGETRTWQSAAFRSDTRPQATVAYNLGLVGAERPMMVQNQRGNWVIAPYVRNLNNALDRQARAASELGFTPSARARVKANAKDPLERQAGVETGRESLGQFLSRKS